MNSRNIILLIVFVLLAVYFCFKAPSAHSIAQEMQVDAENGTIKYKDITYTAEWGDQKIYVGDIRYIGRAEDKNALYITNDAIVTTGEFSDPSIVSVTPIVHGNMYWRAQKQPKGSLVVLHFIPENLLVYEDLARIEKGQRAEFTGREEIDSRIISSNGGYIALGHSNHKFFLLENVRQIDVE